MQELRVGIWTRLTASWPDLVDAWQTIDCLGFDCAAVTDHFMPKDGDEDGPIFEAWSMLSALATHTTRVRVAVIVSGNTYRNPALLAKQAVTLDHITGGRVDLGIGAGWYEREHQAYGFPFPSAGDRVGMLSEAVQIIRRLLHSRPGDRTSFAGRYYQLEDAPFAPPPLQSGGIPIMIAAQGHRMLRLVAEHADIWNLNHSPAKMRELGAVLLDHCAAVGRDPSAIRWSTFTYHGILAYDPFESVDHFRRAVIEYVDAGASEIYLRMPGEDQRGVLEQAATTLHSLRSDYAARLRIT